MTTLDTMAKVIPMCIALELIVWPAFSKVSKGVALNKRWLQPKLTIATARFCRLSVSLRYTLERVKSHIIEWH